ncbi:MAG: glutathione S-transferase family protein [Alphaproteobacteria bacterium]
MTLQIIGFPRSNFVRAVRMAAEEKGVAYALLPEKPHSDAVKAVNPTGKIPGMRHDGLELSESLAIGRYIDDAFDGPKLIPTDVKAAAKVNQWASCAAIEVDQLLMRNYVVEYAFNKDADGNVVRTKIDPALKRFPRMFGMLENAVSGGYFGGDAFSLADCILTPILNATSNFPEGKAAIVEKPALASYFAKMQDRASFKATG